MTNRHPKIIVVGSGISGMAAAVSSVWRGATVTLVSCDIPARSGSASIREGVNVSNDSSAALSAHVSDTIRAGDYLADRRMVEGMCGHASSIIDLLCSMGVAFDRTEDGLVKRLPVLGSSIPRCATAGRATGQRVLAGLQGQVLLAEESDQLHTMFGWEFLSPVIDETGRCRGVVVQNLRNMEIKALPADAVILCTGGYGALFAGSACPAGDEGVAATACCAHGAIFANPEFVQFVPFAAVGRGKCRAIFDSALGLGARAWAMKEGKPWYFMEEWHLGDIRSVSRDALARAVVRAHREASDTGAASINIDLTHLDVDYVYEQMAPLLDACDSIPEFDPRGAPIEVAPAVRYTAGGLWIGADHATSIEGLFAAGSSACAYHGAGVLGGNEILSRMHGALVAAESSYEYSLAAGHAADDVPSSILSTAKQGQEDAAAHIAAQEGTENAHAIRRELGLALHEAVGIERDNKLVSEALTKLGTLKERADRVAVADKSEWANSEIPFVRRLKCNVALAELIVAAALARDESRGAHYKAAFPNRDDRKWQVNTKASLRDGIWKIDYSERVETEAAPAAAAATAARTEAKVAPEVMSVVDEEIHPTVSQSEPSPY